MAWDDAPASMADLIDALHRNAVVESAKWNPHNKNVEVTIDSGYAPDGQARLRHIMDAEPYLSPQDVEDAMPIGRHRLRVLVKPGHRSGSGYGVSL